MILLGQERQNNLWCDFGGGSYKCETTYETAIREGSEELNGLLGTKERLTITVSQNLITSISNNNFKYTSYVYITPYDSNLPRYFANSNDFAQNHLKDKIEDAENGLYEKIKIEWYPLNAFKNDGLTSIVRPHFNQIIKSLIKNERFIMDQLKYKSDEKYGEWMNEYGQ